MVKRTVYEYQIIRFAKHHDVDQSMQMEKIHWNDENHDVIVQAQHQIQPIRIAIVHVHQSHYIKRSTKIAPVPPIRVKSMICLA